MFAALALALALAQSPIAPPALTKPSEPPHPAPPPASAGAAPAAASKPVSAEVAARVEADRKRLVSGDARGAALDLERLLAAAPDTPEAVYWLGLAYLDLGKKDAAREALSDALDMKGGRHPDALYHLGLLALESNDAPGAVTLLERAVDQAPSGFPAAEDALGAAYVSARDYDGAVEFLERVMRSRPDDATAAHLLGTAHEQRFLAKYAPEDADGAVTAYGHAAGARIDYALAERDLGLALLWAGRGADAAAHLERFAAIQPSHPAAPSLAALAKRLRDGLALALSAEATTAAPRFVSGTGLGGGVTVYSPRAGAPPAGFGAGARIVDGVVLADGSFYALGSVGSAAGPSVEDALAASRFAPGRVEGRRVAMRVLVAVR